jgi:uncharacterized phage protein (TIGR02218 family)
VRILPTGMAAHLASGATTLCHCWKLILAAAETMGFTDHDEDLVFDGVTFKAATGFEASEIESSLGLSIDNLEAAGALNAVDLTVDRLERGDLRGATVEIWRVNWQDATQRVLMRKGSIGEVRHGELAFTAEVRGLAHVLDQPKGRIFAYGCDADVGDQRCTVNLDAPSFKGAGLVASVEDNRRFRVTGLDAFADGWFARGKLAWASGRIEDVKFHRAGNAQVFVELWQRAVATVAVGDAFAIRAGCDKQFSTCQAKFSNTVNFRGFPHMPGSDFVASYASREDAKNDGASRNG